MSRYAHSEIDSILEKMDKTDKDFRYMACLDLHTMLTKDSFKFKDGKQETVLSNKLLILLIEDISGDVQTQAQKCLGALLHKISEKQLKDIVLSLVSSMLSGKKDTIRESASYGLKTIISNVPQSQSALLVDLLTPKLASALSTTSNGPEIRYDCLDLLNDLLEKFNHMFADKARCREVRDAVLPELRSSRNNNRKRASSCLAHLCVPMATEDFNALVRLLVSQAKSPEKHDYTRSCIQTLGLVSRSAGYRLAECLPDVVPVIITCTRGETNLRSSSMDDDELREICFQTLESLVFRCPTSIEPYIDTIISLSLEYIKHDPNIAVDMEDVEDGFGDDQDEDEEMFEDGDAFEGFDDEEWDDDSDYSDDDDISWKVRRSSAKTLTAIIATRPKILSQIYESVAPVLINRFKEREVNVKLDVFSAFIELLKQTQKAASLQDNASSDHLRALVPTLISSLAQILKDDKSNKNFNVRVKVFSLIKELVQVVDNSLTGQLAPLIPGINSGLTDNRSNLKTEVLEFLRLLFERHQETAFHDEIEQIAGPIFSCVSDNYYKIVAEALKLCTALVRVLRADPDRFSSVIQQLYLAVLPKLEAQDIDQEVKEAAIICSSKVISELGNYLSTEAINESLSILQQRLSNEITRLTAVKAFAHIAESDLKIDLSSVIGPAVEQMNGFLRLNRRSLKQNTLSTLSIIFATQSSVDDQWFNLTIEQVGPLISDEDLHLSHLALRLVRTVLQVHKESVKHVKKFVFPSILKLLESQLLQGLALESLLELLKEIVAIKASGFSFSSIMKEVNAVVASDTLSKQCYPSIAQCIAILVIAADEKKRKSAIKKFITQLQTQPSVKDTTIALFCVGEIGRRTNLSEFGLEVDIANLFGAQSEELKTAASFALGNVAVGNLSFYLPFILEDFSSNPAHQYLLLQSLREVIARMSVNSSSVEQLIEHLPPVLELLFKNANAEKESVRNVVAECVGRITVLRPAEMIPKLKDVVSNASSSAANKSTTISALKFAISDKPKEVDKYLAPDVECFFSLLSDEHLDVRRAALNTFNYTIHNKPILLLDLLPKLLTAVYRETLVKEDLIRKVRVGPFTHLVDDGLENRKAAYECMYTLLETCIGRINVSEFITHLTGGLYDESSDIKTVCHIMLEHLAQSPVQAAVVLELSNIVEPLKKTLNNKPKDQAVKQEKERYDELARSALRAILAITKIPNVETCTKFTEFMNQVVLVGDIGEKYNALLEVGATPSDPMDLSN